MSTKIRAFAALHQGAQLLPFEFDPGPLLDDEVEIQVSHCGLCHSDVSMIDDEWGIRFYPMVPGHEVAGTVAALGRYVPRLRVADPVGLGWFSRTVVEFFPLSRVNDAIAHLRAGNARYRVVLVNDFN